MKSVAVIHAAFRDSEAPRTVAFVEVPETMEVNEALEYCYRVTNNIEGSWSRGPTFEYKGETYDNPDYNENVTVMAELPVSRDGEVMGLRSTSMGDRMLIGSDMYEVAAFGFKKVSE